MLRPSLSSPERAAKIAAAKRGKPRPKHVIEATRKANLGKKHSEEARKNMSVAQRKRGARPPAAGLLESYSTQRLAKAGQCLDVSINSIALLDKCGMVYAIATAERVTLQDEA